MGSKIKSLLWSKYTCTVSTTTGQWRWVKQIQSSGLFAVGHLAFSGRVVRTSCDLILLSLGWEEAVHYTTLVSSFIIIIILPNILMSYSLPLTQSTEWWWWGDYGRMRYVRPSASPDLIEPNWMERIRCPVKSSALPQCTVTLFRGNQRNSSAAPGDS